MKKIWSAEFKCCLHIEQDVLTAIPYLYSLSLVRSLSRTSSHRIKLNLGKALGNHTSYGSLDAWPRIAFHADFVVKPILQLGFQIN